MNLGDCHRPNILLLFRIIYSPEVFFATHEVLNEQQSFIAIKGLYVKSLRPKISIKKQCLTRSDFSILNVSTQLRWVVNLISVVLMALITQQTLFKFLVVYELLPFKKVIICRLWSSSTEILESLIYDRCSAQLTNCCWMMLPVGECSNKHTGHLPGPRCHQYLVLARCWYRWYPLDMLPSYKAAGDYETRHGNITTVHYNLLFDRNRWARFIID